ncbi:MAG: hypothetical protein ACLUEU_10835 [Oscillospiraceae bacterium]
MQCEQPLSLGLCRTCSRSSAPGGFAGRSDRRIEGCYGIAAIPTAVRGGGWSSAASPRTTAALSAEPTARQPVMLGGQADGFASGGVQDCYYLNGGTYRFWEEDRLYSAETAGGAQPMTAAELKALGLSGFGTSAEARYRRKNTEDSYPYPACMQDASGVLVHYGDWPVPTNVGEVGVFLGKEEEGRREQRLSPLLHRLCRHGRRRAVPSAPRMTTAA